MMLRIKPYHTANRKRFVNLYVYQRCWKSMNVYLNPENAYNEILSGYSVNVFVLSQEVNWS